MTRTTATRVHRPTATAVHDMLVELYDRVHEEWGRQVAIADSMRTSRDVGPGDDADLASIYAHAGEQDALIHALRSQLDDLAVAMERADNGSYGRCEGCQHAIPAARLALFPAATLCVACKQRVQRR